MRVKIAPSVGDDTEVSALLERVFITSVMVRAKGQRVTNFTSCTGSDYS